MKTDSSMNKKKECLGFTLVELIVVIAVLAVLAGVAYPVYTGYIEKANEAADQTLIGALNDAFAAACEEQGVDRLGLPFKTGAKLDTGSQPAIKGILSVYGLTADGLENFQTSFNRYFKGNEKTELQVISIDDIGFANGVFVTDMKKAVTDHAKSVFQDSNFNNNVEGLVESVENVTSLFGQLAENTNTPVANRLALLQILGVDVDSTVAQLKKEYGITDTSTGTEIANAMVLYVAQATNAMDDTSVLIEDLMSGKKGEGRALMELPMMVGLATAYYNSEYASEEYKTEYDKAMKTGGTAILGLSPQDDLNYERYKETEMRADLEGYLGALTLVDQNKNSVDIKRPDAFSNDDFMALIKSVLGS